jgi:uncharacterized protein
VTLSLAFRAGLAAVLLLAACDRPTQPTAAADGNAARLASPAPASSSQRQFPALTGRVVDSAGLLRPEDEARLTETLARLESRTTDQLVVVTVSSLEGRSVEDFSDALANHWQVGQAGRDNGVLLLVAPIERQTRIAIGYGLETVFTNDQAGQIIQRDMLPAFREERWTDGISSAVDSIAGILIAAEHVPRRRAA